MTVSEGSTKQSYRVKQILGDGNQKRRLQDLGFAPGAVIRILRIAPMGGTVLIEIYGCQLALREQAARLIEVEPCR